MKNEYVGLIVLDYSTSQVLKIYFDEEDKKITNGDFDDMEAIEHFERKYGFHESNCSYMYFRDVLEIKEFNKQIKK